MDTPPPKKTIYDTQLDSAKQMQSMFEGDVKKRAEHLATLADGEEKDRYAFALKTAQKSLDDQKAHVARAQAFVTAQQAPASAPAASETEATS